MVGRQGTCIPCWLQLPAVAYGPVNLSQSRLRCSRVFTSMVQHICCPCAADIQPGLYVPCLTFTLHSSPVHC
jgi:hypothetical protein